MEYQLAESCNGPVCLFGVMIDSDLKWQSHVDLVYSKLLKFTGIFYMLRCFLSANVLRLLYFAFVHSQILYGIEVYANICHAQLNKLCVPNNKILRIIQNKPLCTPVEIGRASCRERV